MALTDQQTAGLEKKAKKLRFRLKADNGQIILRSEGYTSKTACQNGVESVKKNSSDAKRFTNTTTPTKMFDYFFTNIYRFLLSITYDQIHE